MEEAQAARRGVDSYKSTKSVPSIIARDCSSLLEACLDWNAECHYVNRGRPVIRCIPERCFYAALLATYNYDYTRLKQQCGSYNSKTSYLFGKPHFTLFVRFMDLGFVQRTGKRSTGAFRQISYLTNRRGLDR